jgi:hypothetical protein
MQEFATLARISLSKIERCPSFYKVSNFAQTPLSAPDLFLRCGLLRVLSASHAVASPLEDAMTIGLRSMRLAMIAFILWCVVTTRLAELPW